MKKANTLATPTAAKIGTNKMIGVFKTPDNNCVNAVVGSMVAAATVSLGREDAADDSINMLCEVGELWEETLTCRWEMSELGANANILCRDDSNTSNMQSLLDILFIVTIFEEG